MPVRERIARMKYVPEDEKAARYDTIKAEIGNDFEALTEGRGSNE